LRRVQHHHAHVAAAMVEHGVEPGERVLGLSFDGTGYGTDGAIWGGELLWAGYDGFERLGHLKPFPLAGGDGAIRFPRRVALALLREAGLAWSADLAPVASTPENERRVLARQFEGRFGVVQTTSMGRLFDAMAALCGVRQEVTYEAQAAMEFEGLVGEERPAQAYAFALTENAPWIADPAPLLRQAVAGLRAGQPVPSIAARFHCAVAELALEWCRRARSTTGIGRVALTGGVFQNVRLLAWTSDLLRREGFEPLIHHKVPPNDGGLALGQAAIVGLGRPAG
jgi:hydrogenase maturation protein HypF